MKTKTWRYLIGFFLILLGGLMLLSRLFDFAFSSAMFGVIFLVGGGLFLIPVFRSKVNWWAMIPGLPLILMGAALVFGALIPRFDDLVGPGFLLGVGLAFIITFLMHNHYWWALIPGVIMGGIGVATLIEIFVPAATSNIIATIILGSIGLAFLLVFFLNRNHWWAIIPAGALASVAAMVLTGMVSMLFIGLAVTFALIPLFIRREYWWGWIVCAVMAIMGIAFLFFETAIGTISVFFFPVVLIILGAVAIIQAVLPRKKRD